MKEKNESLRPDERDDMSESFKRMVDYVRASFVYGFTAGKGKYVSRPVFEANLCGCSFGS